MLAPLARLDGQVVQKASHTETLDSVRLDFRDGGALIACNRSEVDGVRTSIDDASREFAQLVGTIIESIVESEGSLRVDLSRGHVVSIGRSREDAEGPESLQIRLPGYPPIVDQNP